MPEVVLLNARRVVAQGSSAKPYTICRRRSSQDGSLSFDNYLDEPIRQELRQHTRLVMPTAPERPMNAERIPINRKSPLGPKYSKSASCLHKVARLRSDPPQSAESGQMLAELWPTLPQLAKICRCWPNADQMLANSDQIGKSREREKKKGQDRRRDTTAGGTGGIGNKLPEIGQYFGCPKPRWRAGGGRSCHGSELLELQWLDRRP